MSGSFHTRLSFFSGARGRPAGSALGPVAAGLALVLALTNGVRAVAGEEPAVQETEQALRAWELRLEDRQRQAAATGWVETTRAGAELRIQELKDYITRMESAAVTDEARLNSGQEAVGNALRRVMAGWQPPPRDDAYADLPTPPIDPGPGPKPPDGPHVGGTPPLSPVPGDPVPAGLRRPLVQPGNDALYRRALTLPGAKLLARPDGEPAGGGLPVFTPLYVYSEKQVDGQTWFEVGRKAAGQSEGWLPQQQTEVWQSMLVMQYAPRGQRERVLFFENRNDAVDMVRSPYLSTEIKGDYQRIQEGKQGDDIFIAIEPATAVATDRPYLMPVLDWKYEQFDSGQETTLVQVAGLNLSRQAPPDARDRIEQMAEGLGRRQASLREFRIGIVFVIDTTASMGPYIDETRQIVTRLYAELQQRDLLKHVGFGLVGYRDNVTPDPRIGYVTQTFLRLTPDADPLGLFRALAQIQPATVSTRDWREDAFAGLHVAMDGMDWAPFAARIVILISDAGARSGTDELASMKFLDTTGLLDMAARKRIAIVPIHLLTNEAVKSGDVESARAQYLRLAMTGDQVASKYLGIEVGSLKSFGREIASLAGAVEQVVADASRGHRQERPDLDSAVLLGQPLDVTEHSAPRLGAIFVNEVFRAQLEYLGQVRGTEAPRFYRAWAADRDLVNPQARSLIVSVFLTRNQLNSLAQGLQRLVDEANAAGTSAAESLFDKLRLLSAATSVDPNRSLDDDSDFVMGKLLPSFLEQLPYRSKVLRLNKQLWLDRGVTGQKEFINELEDKLAAYRRINEDRNNWIDLGAGDPALEVYAIDLDLLP